MFANCFFYVVGMLLAILVHEAGHWLAGIVVGVPVYSVSVSTGRVVARRRLGTTAFELRRLGFNGEVLHALLLPIGRFAYVVLLLGGVLGNIALIGLIALVSLTPAADVIAVAAPGVTLAQAFTVILNLLPLRGKWGKSDGYQIIEVLIRGTRPMVAAANAAYAAMLRPYAAAGGAEGPVSRASCRILFHRQRLELREERVDAAAALLDELDRGQTRPDETLFLLDCLITNHLLRGDLGLGPRLDELSSRAIALAPDLATLRGTRGAVLLELGRHAEGKALLAPFLDGAPSYDTALSCLFLARAEHGRGDLAEARRLLDAARAALRAAPYPAAAALVARTQVALDKDERVAQD